MPRGESVALELVRDTPWGATVEYLGGLSAGALSSLDMGGRSDTQTVPRGILIGSWLTVAVVLASGLAYLLTWNGCSGDGSFDALGPGSRRSAYCRALNAPAAPTTLGAVALTLVLFALPTVVWIAVAFAARRRGSFRPFKVAVGLCGALLVASLAMLAFADASFVGGFP